MRTTGASRAALTTQAAKKILIEETKKYKVCGYFLDAQAHTTAWVEGAQPVKLDLNKKSFPKQKTIQNFTIDAQGFRKTKNENPPTWEMGVTR